MAFLETGVFCSTEEYRYGLHRRKDEHQLQLGDIYTLATLVDSNTREAAKLAVRPLELIRKTGLVLVHFTFLDPDLKPTNETEEVIADGVMNKVKGVLVVDNEKNEKYSIVQAYFRDYFEDQFSGLLADDNRLSLAG